MRLTTILENALLYATKGIKLFPVNGLNGEYCTCGRKISECTQKSGKIQAGKHPVIKFGSWTQLSTCDADKIKEWFKINPHFNIAIHAGANNFVNIDFDDELGRKTFEELFANHPEWFNTVIEETGRGYHLYYYQPATPITGFNTNYGEVRVNDQYTVCAPSRHYSGNNYKSIPGHAFHEINVTALPDDFLTYLRSIAKKKPESKTTPIDDNKAIDNTDTTEIENIIQKYSISDKIAAYIKVQTIGETEDRSKTLMKIAFHLYNKHTPNNDILKVLKWTKYNKFRGRHDEDKWLSDTLNAVIKRKEQEDLEKETEKYLDEAVLDESNNDQILNLTRNHMTDLANGERFRDQNSENVRYCSVWGKWLSWDNTRWKVDDDDAVKRLAVNTVFSIYLEALNSTGDKREKMLKWGMSSESRAGITNMLEMGSSMRPIAISSKALDDPINNRNLLNLNNGTYDLDNNEIRDHKREDLITKLAPVNYNKDAKCPKWMDFLNIIFNNDKDTILSVQKALGYTLSGLIGEKCFFVCYGKTNTGKTTFIDTIALIMGDYCSNVPPETFMVKDRNSGINNDVAMLKGARLVTSAETEKNKKLAEAFVKAVTGGDDITARFLHQEFFTFKPEFKLWFSTNHRPKIADTDDAIWNRVRLIPFEVNVPEKMMALNRPAIKDYYEVLFKEESSGILNWMIEGYQKWKKEGLTLSKAIVNAINVYRRDMDILESFIQEECILDTKYTTKSKELYESYKQWCSINNEFPIKAKDFNERLEEKNLRKVSGHARSFNWQGIGIRSEDSQTTMNGENGVSGESLSILPLVSTTSSNNMETPSPTSPFSPVTFVNNVNKSPIDQKEKVNILLGTIGKIEKQNVNGAPIGFIISDAKEKGLDETYINDEIKKLKEIGEIMEVRKGYFAISQG